MRLVAPRGSVDWAMGGVPGQEVGDPQGRRSGDASCLRCQIHQGRSVGLPSRVQPNGWAESLCPGPRLDFSEAIEEFHRASAMQHPAATSVGLPALFHAKFWPSPDQTANPYQAQDGASAVAAGELGSPCWHVRSNPVARMRDGSAKPLQPPAELVVSPQLEQERIPWVPFPLQGSLQQPGPAFLASAETPHRWRGDVLLARPDPHSLPVQQANRPLQLSSLFPRWPWVVPRRPQAGRRHAEILMFWRPASTAT